MAPPTPTEHDAISPRHGLNTASVLGHAHSLQHTDEQAHQKRRCSMHEEESCRPAAAVESLPGIDEDALLAPLPVAEPALGEPIASYFGRLRGAVDTSALRAVDPKDMHTDGMYLHKRPVHGADPSSPLNLCGSVLHHCILYIKHGDELHSLDFGPGNGADISSNLFTAVPSRAVHCGPRVTVPTEDTLPMLYLGPAPEGWQSDEDIQKALRFAESRPYHAVHNNCIHFADFAVRLLTHGSLRAAPLLYDLCCGTVPPMDPPMLAMLSMMFRLSWFDACDGRRLVKDFRAASAGGVPAAAASQQPAATAMSFSASPLISASSGAAAVPATTAATAAAVGAPPAAGATAVAASVASGESAGGAGPRPAEIAVAARQSNASMLLSVLASAMNAAGQEALVQSAELAQALDAAISGAPQSCAAQATRSA